MVDITVLNNMEYADAENFVHNNGYINTIGADEVAASKSDSAEIVERGWERVA